MVVLYQCYFPDFDDYIWLCRRMPSLQEMQSTLKRVCVCVMYLSIKTLHYLREDHGLRFINLVQNPGSVTDV